MCSDFGGFRCAYLTSEPNNVSSPSRRYFFLHKSQFTPLSELTLDVIENVIGRSINAFCITPLHMMQLQTNCPQQYQEDRPMRANEALIGDASCITDGSLSVVKFHMW